MTSKQCARLDGVAVNAAPTLRYSFSPAIVKAILILSFGALVSAQGPRRLATDVSTSGWTLESLQKLALEHNPTINQSIAAVNVARGSYKQYGLYPNPQVGYVQTNANGGAPARAPGAFFSQEIVTAGKLKKSQAAQSAEIDRNNANFQAQRQRILNDVELRFIDVLAIQESTAFADEHVEIARRILAETEEFFRKKEASRHEVIQARMQLRTAAFRRRDIEIQLETAWKQLIVVVGCEGLGRSQVQGTLDGEIPELDWETSWRTILECSPLMHAAEARIRVARGDYQVERAYAVPNLNFQVLADREVIQGTTTVSALLSAPLPIFNRNQGNIDKAAAETHEAVAERDRTRLALRDELAEAFGRYQLARAQVIELRDELLPLAKESLDVTKEDEDEKDETSSDDVLTAEKVYLDARASYVDGWAELRKVVVEIRGMLLTGALNPSEIGTALQHQRTPNDSRRNVIKHVDEGLTHGPIPAMQLLGE